jgi:hypothetical protein
MTAQASARHLHIQSLEADQATPSQDAGSRQRTWFLQGMGFAALMLVGARMGGLKFEHESPSGSENPSGYGEPLAFSPLLAGATTRGRLAHSSSVSNSPAVASLPQLRTATLGISMAADKFYTPILGRLGEKKFVTGLAESGLLSGVENAGLLSKLEKAGLFSTVEKLLPVADELGAPQFLQGVIDNPGGLSAGGAALVALGPIYAALVAQGILDSPLDGGALEAFIPGLLLTATTSVGAAFIGVSNQLAQINKGETAFADSETPLLGKLGDAKVSTFLAKQGLLSKAEEAGVFSTLEENGLLSVAENALPTIDKLGLLQFLQGAIDSKPADNFALSAALLVVGPSYGKLVSVGLLPDIPVLPTILFTGTTLAGLATATLGIANVAPVEGDDGNRRYKEYLASVQAQAAEE